MRILLALLCIFAGIPQAWANADETKDEEKMRVEREDRSRYAVDLFRKVCFMNFSDPEAMVSNIDQAYKRANEKDRQKFLRFVHAEDGAVWNAAMAPKASYTIVVSGSGSCHVIAQKTSGEKLHKEIKNLAMDVRDSMSFSVVDYKGVAPGLIQNSEFTVKAPDGSVVLVVSVATRQNPETEAAEGVISIVAPKE